MFLVTCMCSDDGCAVEVVVLVGRLEEADRELCPDCDCVVQVLGVAEAELVEAAPVPPVLLALAA